MPNAKTMILNDIFNKTNNQNQKSKHLKVVEFLFSRHKIFVSITYFINKNFYKTKTFILRVR